MKSSSVFAVAITLVTLSLIGVALLLYPRLKGRFNLRSRTLSTLHLWSFEYPESLDPIDYDPSSHHVAFTSVFSNLITQYAKGKYQGILAESWTANDDFTRWVFKIRPDAYFDDGTKISPEIIFSNIKRINYLMAKRGSHSDLFNNLEGYVEPLFADSGISGIETEDDTIAFKFSKPVPELLNTLSFGLYAIIHPSNFDPKTGVFINKEHILYSGRYKITGWSNSIISYEMRTNFLPNVFPQNNFQYVKFTTQPGDKSKADISIGYSNDISFNKTHHFYGPIPYNIMYIHCVGWWREDSPLHEREFRIALREAFYEQLKNNSNLYVRSFFPLSMTGVSELPAPQRILLDVFKKYKGTSLKVKVRPAVTAANPDISRLLVAAIDDVGLAGVDQGALTPTDFFSLAKRQSQESDIVSLVTGILVQNPYNDIRFMLNSKEGINLPDINGKMRELSLKSTFDVQVINKELYEQAIIWPVAHITKGLWVKPHIDMSQYNVILPPIDFSWIGALGE